MTPPSSALIQQAKAALKTGDKQEASRLLQQALRMDDKNHVAWVMMAVVSDSPQSSLACVRRAEALNAHDPLVIKARSWVDNRLKKNDSQPALVKPTPPLAVELSAVTAATAPVQTGARQPAGAAEPIDLNQFEYTPQPAADASERSQPRWQAIAIRGSIILLLGIILTAGAILTWSMLGGSTAAEASDETADSSGLNDLPAATVEIGNSTAVATSLPPTETATATPIRVMAKHVAPKSEGDDSSVRATWTPTPRPTQTPSPTPTYVATYVSPDQTRPEVRPMGVGINDKWIDVNLSEQTLTAYEGNTVVYNTLVSSGLRDFPTVTGQFRIWLRFQAQTMDGSRLGYDYYLENVPYVMYFYEDYALHGTFWHNNFGTPMSHGCVNLKTSDAEWIYNWSSLGTTVNVHN